MKKKKEMIELSLQQAKDIHAKINDARELESIANSSLPSVREDIQCGMDIKVLQEGTFVNLSEEEKRQHLHYYGRAHEREETYYPNKKSPPPHKAFEIHLVNGAKFDGEMNQNREIKILAMVEKIQDLKGKISDSSDTTETDESSSCGQQDILSVEQEEGGSFVHGAECISRESNDISEMTLSEIQVLKAILLAELASQNGQEEFRTSDYSWEDFNEIDLADEIEAQDATGMVRKVHLSNKNKHKLKKGVKRFFIHAMKQTKLVQALVGLSTQQPGLFYK